MQNPTWNHSRCGEEYGSPASSRSTWGLPVALPRNSAFPTWFQWLANNCPKIKRSSSREWYWSGVWFDLRMKELEKDEVFAICSVAKAFPIFWQMIPLKMTSVSTLKKTPCPGSRFPWSSSRSSSTSSWISPCPGRRSQLWSTVDLPWYLPCVDVFSWYWYSSKWFCEQLSWRYSLVWSFDTCAHRQGSHRRRGVDPRSGKGFLQSP